MSHRLISRSPDLKRLQDEGYEVEVKSGHLLIKHVPYVNSRREISYGVLATTLDLAGDITAIPSDHVAKFAGDHPCNIDGSEIAQIKHSSSRQEYADGLVLDHMFSAKPTTGGYTDYYHKITTYASIISSPACAIDATVTATTFPVIEAEEDETVFRYIDTASSRAEIDLVTRKLALAKIAIVGLGGTGSFILDLVAKTPVKEIHLFDGDWFLQHNAFRSPGAPSVAELRSRPKKVGYLSDRYSFMRHSIIAHDYYLDASNVENLRGMDFVFLSLDSGSAKRVVVAKLEEFGIPFVDVGMGLEATEGSLGGIVRVTTSTPQKRGHVSANGRIPFSNGDVNNEYSHNIQIADLNALNAALAVIKWKKLSGFYRDLGHEHYTTYTIDQNLLINEDQL